MWKGSGAASQAGCAGAMQGEGWNILAELGGPHSGGRRGRRGGQRDVHPAIGSAGRFRGELGLQMEGRAGLGGLDKEESKAHTENVHPSCLELI